ncbi:MAG: AAA family ATPase [Acidimicrobiaceae bacterium]|nr:AAA family ATPase [Acidimicrobiaceae bacterium]
MGALSKIKLTHFEIRSASRNVSGQISSSNLVVVYGPNEAGKSSFRQLVTDYLYRLAKPKDPLFGSIGIEIDDARLRINRDEKGRRVELLSEKHGLSSQARLVYELLSATKSTQLNQLGRLCVVGYSDLGLFTNASPKEVESLVAAFVQSGGTSVDLSLVSDTLRKSADEIYRPRADCRLRRLLNRYETLKGQRKEIEGGFIESFELQKANERSLATLEWIENILVHLRQVERLLATVEKSLQEMAAGQRSSLAPSHLPRLAPSQIDDLRNSVAEATRLSREIEAKKLERSRLSQLIRSSSFTTAHRVALFETYKALEIDLAGIDEEVNESQRDLREADESLEHQLLICRGEVPKIELPSQEFEASLSLLKDLGAKLSAVDSELIKARTIRATVSVENRSLDEDEEELASKRRLLASLEEYLASARRLRETEDHMSRIKRRRTSPVITVSFTAALLIVMALVAFSSGSESPSANFLKFAGIAVGLLLLIVGFVFPKGAGDEVDRALFDSFKEASVEHRDSSRRLIETLGSPILTDEVLGERALKLSAEVALLSARASENRRSLNVDKSLSDEIAKYEIERDAIVGRIEEVYVHTFNVCYRHGPVERQTIQDRELWRLAQSKEYFRQRQASLIEERESLRGSFDRHAASAFGSLSRLARNYGQKSEVEELRRELCDLERITNERNSELARLDEEHKLLLEELTSRTHLAKSLFSDYGLLYDPSTVDELLHNLSLRREDVKAFEIQRQALADGISAMRELYETLLEFTGAQSASFSGSAPECVSIGTFGDLFGFLRSEVLGDVLDDLSEPEYEFDLKIGEYQHFGELARSLCQELDQIRDRLRIESSHSVRRSLELQEISVSDLSIELAEVAEEMKAALVEFTKLSLGKELVERSRLAFAKAGQPVVLAQASQIFSIASGGRYKEIVALRGGTIYVIDEKNRELQTSELSSGTLDLLLLSLRVAYLAIDGSVQQGWPVIFDDVMVNIDTERRRYAYQAVLRASASRQLFYLTCHLDHAQGLIQAAREFRESNEASGYPGLGWDFEEIELDRIRL